MQDQRSQSEFHRADPAWRRRVRLWTLVVAVLGICGLALLNWWLSGMQAQVAAGHGHQFRYWMQLLTVVFCLAFAGTGFALAAYLWRNAAATRAERRWPPSAMRTTSDVRIRYLTAADGVASTLKGGAIALVLVCVGVLAWGAWLLK